MQDDKQLLDIDLSFLDGKPREEAQQTVGTGYKYNWKNIALFAAITLGIGVVIIANQNSTPSAPPWNTQITGESHPSPPVSYNRESVNVGQYRCSQYDSRQADQLNPGNSFALDAEGEALEGRSNALSALRLRIEASNISRYSSQSEIDQYNEMIDEYNARLSSYKSDAASLQGRIRQFNTRIETYNNYLIAHCSR